MSGITTVERIVLESLGQAPKDIPRLMADTRLELRFLANVLHALTLRGLVVQDGAGYACNRHLPAAEIEEMNAPLHRRGEALELLGGLLGGENRMRVQKAWMTDKDRTILRALLKNVEDFVKNLPAPPKGAATHTWSVVAWGEDQYGAVLNRLLGEV
jgi:hypothetical protein